MPSFTCLLPHSIVEICPTYNLGHFAMNNGLIAELYRLRNERPKDALARVKELGGSAEENIAASIILIDCGDALGDFTAVSEGADRLRKELENIGTVPELAYNLANGLQVRARLTYGPVSPFRGQASDDRFKARGLFGAVMRDPSASTDLKSQASTNIGILLLETHRWIEGIDYFQQAVETLPSNGVAAYQEMRRLMGLANLFSREPSTYQTYCNVDALLIRIRQLAEIVSSNYQTVADFAGAAALPIVEKATQDAMSISVTTKMRVKTPYFAFVESNNLALSLHCSTEEYESGRFDMLSIPSIQTTLADGPEVPEVFAEMNVMKADFAFARQLFFDIQENGSETPFFETTTHADTLDYALYGVRYSALTIAQRIAYDILDKISVALAQYFRMNKSEKMYFTSIWGKLGKGKIFEYAPEIEAELSKGNGGLIALNHIFQDISKDDDRGSGFMEEYKRYRHSSTHRFTVLHDMGSHGGPSSSLSVEHQRVEVFERLTLQSLRLARAALFYFVDTIVFAEEGRKGESPQIVMSSEVPDHDYIRGRR